MSRNLQQNSQRIFEQLENINDITQRELMRIYAQSLNDVRSTLSRLYESYAVSGEFTRAQLTQFVRLSGVESEIVRIMEPYLSRSITEIQTAAQVAVDQSFYRTAWAIDQAAGVQLNWGLLDDRQVRAAAGIIDDAQALSGFMSSSEVKRHKGILDTALRNYQGDTRKWLGQQVTKGIIEGKSVSQVARELKDISYGKSIRSAMTIARTETLRAMGIGTRLAYEESADHGVPIRQVWDATLDDRTRPDHVVMDGRVKDGEFFNSPVGPVRGPRESGDPGFDINCRCRVTGEIEGFAPSVRRIRDEGIVPYKTASEWLQEKGATANRYGQKYRNL